MQIVIETEQCDECGGELLLRTEAVQPEEGWAAYDGDEAVCTECGLVHGVHHDGEGGPAWLGAD